jgi:hypothetical protein
MRIESINYVIILFSLVTHAENQLSRSTPEEKEKEKEDNIVSPLKEFNETVLELLCFDASALLWFLAGQEKKKLGIYIVQSFKFYTLIPFCLAFSQFAPSFPFQ